MTTLVDLYKRFLLFIPTVIICFILFNIDFFPYGIPLGFISAMIPFIAYFIILQKFKDKKQATRFLKSDLARLNYTILSERPLTGRELYENFESAIGYSYLNDSNTNGWLYKNKMLRRFVVKNEKDQYFELIITIVQTWRDKFIFKINGITRLPDEYAN